VSSTNKGRDIQKDTPTMVVLIAAWLIGVRQSESRAQEGCPKSVARDSIKAGALMSPDPKEEDVRSMLPA
jgi:hypothetical protein